VAISAPTAAFTIGGGVAGGALGWAGGRRVSDADPDSIGQPFVHAAVGTTVGVGVGALAWRARNMTSLAVNRTSGRAVGSITRNLPRTLASPATLFGLGAVAGGMIGSKVSDDPVSGAAKGAVAGGAGVLGLRGAIKFWGKANWMGKAAMGTAGVAAVAVAGRAFAHQDTYGEEGHTVSDGAGGYGTESGLRERLAAMNGSGDLVFGLHARRH
jgi:hypothetical protein